MDNTRPDAPAATRENLDPRQILADAILARVKATTVDEIGPPYAGRIGNYFAATPLDLADAGLQALTAAGWQLDRAAELARLRSERDQARRLLETAHHLCMHGERAPGGTETWAQWHRDVETFLRAALDGQAGGAE